MSDCEMEAEEMHGDTEGAKDGTEAASFSNTPVGRQTMNLRLQANRRTYSDKLTSPLFQEIFRRYDEYLQAKRAKVLSTTAIEERQFELAGRSLKRKVGEHDGQFILPTATSPQAEGVAAPSSEDFLVAEVMTDDSSSSISRSSSSSIAEEPSILDTVAEFEDISMLQQKGFTTKLRGHQLQGLQRFLKWERRSVSTTIGDVIAFTETVGDTDGNLSWKNTVDGSVNVEAPILPKGGILADDKSLGKTYLAIAIAVMSDAVNGTDYEALPSPMDPDIFIESTLVVCPKALLDQWANEIATHCNPQKVKYLKYDESMAAKLRKDPFYKTKLNKYKFILTTYEVAIKEYKIDYPKGNNNERAGSTSIDSVLLNMFSSDNDNDDDNADFTHSSSTRAPLMQAEWKRLIVDEVHNIRNRSSLLFKTMTAIQTGIKLGITSTPLVNNLNDVGSLAIWLDVAPFNQDHSKWPSLQSKKKDNTSLEQARAIVQAFYQDFILQRTKDMKYSDGTSIVPLP